MSERGEAGMAPTDWGGVALPFATPDEPEPEAGEAEAQPAPAADAVDTAWAFGTDPADQALPFGAAGPDAAELPPAPGADGPNGAAVVLTFGAAEDGTRAALPFEPAAAAEEVDAPHMAVADEMAALPPELAPPPGDAADGSGDVAGDAFVAPAQAELAAASGTAGDAPAPAAEEPDILATAAEVDGFAPSPDAESDVPAADIFAALGLAPPPEAPPPAPQPALAATPAADTGVTAGLFGKLPAHGDFVQRGLPRSFREPWDAWLARSIAAARATLGDRFDSVWQAAPVWRFALPAGACGPDPVAGVMAPSADTVGRRFPLTAVALRPGKSAALWPPEWFAQLEGVVLAGRAGLLDADGLAAALPLPSRLADAALAPEPGWWTAGSAEAPGLVWPLPALPAPEDFVLLLESQG